MKDLRSLFTSNIQREYVLVSCIFHTEDTPSLAIYTDHAYCYGKCGRRYSYWDIITKLGGEPPIEFVPKKVENPIPTPTQLISMAEQYHRNLFILKKEEWYNARGIRNNTIKDFKLGYTGRAFSIPIYCTICNTTTIRTIRFRRSDEEAKGYAKYWGITGLNNSFLYAPNGIKQNIYISEGEIDTIILCQEGYCGLTITNGITNLVTSLFGLIPSEGIETLTLCLDQDATSYRKSLELASLLREKGKQVKIIRFPFKDINDLFLVKGKEGLVKYLGESK